MTEQDINILELKDAMNNLYPLMQSYYKIKHTIERLEAKQNQIKTKLYETTQNETL